MSCLCTVCTVLSNSVWWSACSQGIAKCSSELDSVLPCDKQARSVSGTLTRPEGRAKRRLDLHTVLVSFPCSFSNEACHPARAQ